MKVVCICNQNNDEYVNLASKLQAGIFDISNDNKFVITSKLNLRNKYEVYIVLSNDIEEITEYIQKIQVKNRILIITGNLDSTHVMKCINITSNICHMKSNQNILISKIYEVCMSNNSI